MTNSIVTHAEWNPDNEVIIYVAPVDDSGVIVGAKERIILENINEDGATTENVKNILLKKGYTIRRTFTVY